MRPTRVGLVITSQPAQFLDVLFQTLDFQFAGPPGRRLYLSL